MLAPLSLAQPLSFPNRPLTDRFPLPAGKDGRLTILHAEPLPDFGGLHADPNLVHAKALMALMGVNSDGLAVANPIAPPPTFGAAADGDGDRNMILGSGVFVSPSDSLAVMAAHLGAAVPWFRRAGGVKAIARSMPTSRAVDAVAAARGIELFVVPTGWKYFGNLMDQRNLVPLLCGEESFGTSSDHIREKDGLWAVLAWLSILAEANKNVPVKPVYQSSELVGVDAILTQHWQTYGRHYYARYDYEDVPQPAGKSVLDLLAAATDGTDPAAWAALSGTAKEHGAVLNQSSSGMFAYHDHTDGSTATNQGIQLFLRLEPSSVVGPEPAECRAVFRLSGTSVGGATVRMYLERFAPPGLAAGQPAAAGLDLHPRRALEPLAAAATVLARLKKLLGKAAPDLVT